ncbi:MAG: DUF1589 domain-containing protein [bacterium]|nr:DUF1589 domain-containing protein [bacterium]
MLWNKASRPTRPRKNQRGPSNHPARYNLAYASRLFQSQPAALARPPPVAGFAKNSDFNQLEHLNTGEASYNASFTTPSSIRIDCVVR